MKTTILKEKLKEGIGIVERISAKSLTLPILNNVLLNTEKNFLNLSSTDLEIGIKWWALVKMEKEGKVTVPSRVFSSFVNFLPNKPVILESKDFNLRVECENYQNIINGSNPEDFPIIPEIAKIEGISLSSRIFCKNLSRVVDIASFSSTKPEISGIYLVFQKDLITMVATDSFRLGEQKVSLKASLNNISKDYSLILPQRAAKEIINIFSEKEEDLKIYFSPNQVLFETSFQETDHPQIQVISRLIEGDYPNYQEIIPKKYETKVTLPINEFINQVKLASLFSGKINEIKLKIDPKKNQVDFFSQSPEVGEHHSFLSGQIEGKPCDISFNYRFLLDGLLSVSQGQEKSSQVVFDLSGSEKPGIIRQKGNEDYLYLVMPIKTS